MCGSEQGLLACTMAAFLVPWEGAGEGLMVLVMGVSSHYPPSSLQQLQGTPETVLYNFLSAQCWDGRGIVP